MKGKELRELSIEELQAKEKELVEKNMRPIKDKIS